MRSKKTTCAISLFLLCCMLLALLPVYALADESDFAPAALVSEKGSPVTSALLPIGETAAELTPLSPPNTFAAVFPDPALAQAVAALWQEPVTARVTQADLDRVLFLEADGRGITNLAGMQFLRSLQGADLNRNRISDLSPLAGLRNLEILTLDDNQINNLQPLAGLTNLEWLWLDDNQINYIQPLAGLTNLGWLTLVGNQIQDIAPLSGLRNAYSLWLNENRISDLRPLAGLTQLRGLWLDGNQIADLRPLAGLANLRDLGEVMETDDFMLGLWIGGQNMTRPTVMQTNPLVLENPLFHPDGTRIAPFQISDGGAYTEPNLRWTELPANTEQVTYAFLQNITIGSASDFFYGTVVQPLSVTPFSDIHRGQWFHDAVAFVFDRDVMNGTSPTTFDPGGTLTRAHVARMLWNVEGQPPVEFRPIFTDVPETDTWYRDAVVWAGENGIVLGYQGRFDPHGNITREQFAIMMFRYARFAEQDITMPTDFTLNQFTDQGAVSSWALNYVRWAVYVELITGTPEGRIAPQGTAVRAEAATILMRYIQRFG